MYIGTDGDLACIGFMWQGFGSCGTLAVSGVREQHGGALLSTHVKPP